MLAPVMLVFLGLVRAGPPAPAEVELPFPFPVQAVLSVPQDVSREWLLRFREVRGLGLEIRCREGNLLRDALVELLNGPFGGAARRVVLRPPLKPAAMDQIRRVRGLEVVVETGPEPLGPDDQRELEGLGPVHVVRLLPTGFSREALQQADRAKHTSTAFDLGPRRLSEENWLWLLKKPRRARTFVLSAEHPAAGVIELTRARPLGLEVRTVANRLPDELLAILKDLRGVEIVVVVDGRFTREHASPWTPLERFKLKVIVDRPGEVTPGLAALLSRLGPR